MLAKALAYDLACIAPEKGAHPIEPESLKVQTSPSTLTCQKNAWVLIVDRVPQTGSVES
jgi:hypothetical protein